MEATKDQIVHLESLISGLKQEKLAPEQLIPVNQEVTTSTDFSPAETEQNTEELVILRKQLAEMVGIVSYSFKSRSCQGN